MRWFDDNWWQLSVLMMDAQIGNANVAVKLLLWLKIEFDKTFEFIGLGGWKFENSVRWDQRPGFTICLYFEGLIPSTASTLVRQ